MQILRDQPNKSKIRSTSPSCKFIMYLLKQKGPMHHKEIIKASLLTKRTVVNSLNTLIDLDCIEKRKDKEDKRMRIYDIKY